MVFLDFLLKFDLALLGIIERVHIKQICYISENQQDNKVLFKKL